MTAPRTRPVPAQDAGAGAQPGAGRTAGFEPGPAWMRVLPPVATFVIMMWGITGASYWRDEAATLGAVQRSFADLLRMLGNIDAVHGAYYILIWAFVRVGGTGELVTRLPSAVAMAGAAAAVAALGRRLVSPRAGLASGLVFAVLPPVSMYGQDARPYAIVVMLAAVASYLLVRAMAAERGRRVPWLVGYAACLAVLGIVDIFGLLLIAAHAVTVALRCLRTEDSRSARSLALGWLAAAVAGTILTSPVLALGYVQKGTLSWLLLPGLVEVRGLTGLIGPGPMAAAVALVVAAGIVVSAVAGREGGRGGGWGLRADWPGSLPALCLPWLILPPAILLIGSLITPLYTLRYVLMCIPAIALLAGAGLAAIGWIAGTAALAVITLLGGSAQLAERAPNGHTDNVRRADRIVAANLRPGDAVLEFKAENFAEAYPFGIRDLNNIAQARTPVQSATLIGTFLPDPVVRQRLAHVSRVWVVEYGHRVRLPILNGLHFRLVRAWQTSDIWLFLYAQSNGD